MRLKELEKRLRQEPDNLGLRVTVAGLMREAGRSVEAVELYRSVAIAYREQGRTQQAIAVCRSILEIAPDDAACKGLLAMLQAGRAPTPVQAAGAEPSEPPERASLDETPLPRPVPHHVVDPTSRPYKISESELDLPGAEGADTRPGADVRPETTGLAQAARRISGLISSSAVPSEIDLSAELETRQRPRISSAQLAKLDAIDSAPVARLDVDDADDIVTAPARDIAQLVPRDSESELATTKVAALESLDARSSEDDLTTPRNLFDDDD